MFKKEQVLFVVLSFWLVVSLAGCSVFALNTDISTGSYTEEYAELVADAGCVPAPGVDGTDFKVLLLADSHFGRLGRDSGVFEKDEEIKAWYDAQVALGVVFDYTISLGDTTDQSTLKEYGDSKAFFDSISEGKFLATIGNHDIKSGLRDNFTAVFGRPMHFKVELHGLSFYFVDNANRTLGREQLAELEAAMEADPNEKIVITHYPVNPSATLLVSSMADALEVNALVDLFLRSDVKMVLGGHYHRGQRVEHYGDITELVFRPAHGRLNSITDFPNASWYVLDFKLDENVCDIYYYFLSENQEVPAEGSLWTRVEL